MKVRKTVAQNNHIHCNSSTNTSSPAGRLQFFSHEWQKLTSDQVILSYVTGCKIEFQDTPVQLSMPTPIPFNQAERGVMDIEIGKLLEKGVIRTSVREHGEYVSNIFTRPKKNGSHRPILNLKRLN